MKPSFSLKWLFVSIAFLASLCGWIADHRRLASELHQKNEEIRLGEWLVLDRENVLRDLVDLLRSDFEHVSIIADSSGELRLFLSGGELNETLATTLVASRWPVIDLRVKILPEAEKVMARRYDFFDDYPNQRYRLRLP